MHWDKKSSEATIEFAHDEEYNNFEELLLTKNVGIHLLANGEIEAIFVQNVTRKPHLRYDKEANMAYLRLIDDYFCKISSKRLNPKVIADYNDENDLIGIEFFCNEVK